jgi:hypothetical protein
MFEYLCKSANPLDRVPENGLTSSGRKFGRLTSANDNQCARLLTPRSLEAAGSPRSLTMRGGQHGRLGVEIAPWRTFGGPPFGRSDAARSIA